MSEPPQTPQVIDLELILKPISDELPSGESLRYSGLYDEISEARRADDVLNQGDWQTELKVADYKKVIELAVPALETLSKDLQVASWLSETLIKTHGFAGLRDSLKLLAGRQERFWETLHPQIDEGDMEGRANAVAWLDAQGAAAVKTCAFTAGAGFGFNDWVDAKTFDIPANLESLDADSQQKFNQLKEQAEAENRVTAEKWKAATGQTNRAFIEEKNSTLDECWTAFSELNRVIEENYDRNQMPGLGALKKSLDDVHGQVKKLLDKKRIEEPDPDDAFEEEETMDGDESSSSLGPAVSGGGGGPVKDRPEALRRLAEIAAFFLRTEPHSPISYLVQRAVKWGNMPLDNWLREVIKDDSVLGQLRETLGIENTMASGSWGSDSDGSSSSETSPEETPQEETASSDW